MSVDLNADLGELPGAAGAELDAIMISVVSSASIACGGHAGDAASMRRVSGAAARTGVAIGAHVSYPDRANFGRRAMAIGVGELEDSLRTQLQDLITAAAAEDAQVRFIKAHGALYNASVLEQEPAAPLTRLAADFGLPLLTMAGGCLARQAEQAGVPVFAEFFADRAYEADGNLRSRQAPGAVLTDPVLVGERVVRAVQESRVVSHDGVDLEVAMDSICVHGDTAGAVALARTVHESLTQRGIAVAPFTS